MVVGGSGGGGGGGGVGSRGGDMMVMMVMCLWLMPGLMNSGPEEAFTPPPRPSYMAVGG